MKKARKVFSKGSAGRTMDYKNFKSVKFNRGRKSSIDRKRVDAIKTMILTKVYFDVSIVIINVYGYIIDGHHTFTALSELGLEIPYYVSNDLQTTDTKTLVKAISRINAHNSKWQKSETSLTAKQCGFPLALKVDEIVEAISGETSIKVNKIMESWIFALIHQNAKFFHSSKELDLVEAFDNDEALALTKTATFESDVDLYIEIIERVKHIGSRFNNACSAILDLYWNNQIFDVNVLLSKIDAHGFNPLTDGKKDVKTEIQRIYNFGRGRAKVYNQFYKFAVPHRNSNDVIKAYLLNNK